MKLLTFFIQYKFQTVVVVLLSFILSGVVVVFEKQAQNQADLYALVNSKTLPRVNPESDKVIELLKNIQTAQTEQNALLAQLVSTSKAQNQTKIPPSKMNRFKSGNYKLSKGKTW